MKEAIFAAILFGAIGVGTGGGIAVTQYLRPPPASDNSAWIEGVRQLHDQIADSVQIQKALLEVMKQGRAEQLDQAVRLDAHVLEIACLIKGCKPQALR